MPAMDDGLYKALDIVRTHVAADDRDAASLQALTDAFEREALEDALRRTRGNRARAARLLSTTERIFNYKVRKLGIEWRRFKK